MEFNPDICQILTRNAKYFGVTIGDDFCWTKHIENVSCKASSTLRLIEKKEIQRIQCNIWQKRESAYNTYVRLLEIYSTI